ncbi:hypothetical protein PV327_011320 [Microctonus hyperodae]|uniref:Uncharacterized protein n=1 Tax=Microctonus hyperodae TaxID=165561 RepID=A0AA39KRV3_MICHY|nr:hypothetical protein PV327_011320 [Microctonus hyperodae]
MGSATRGTIISGRLRTHFSSTTPKVSKPDLRRMFGWGSSAEKWTNSAAFGAHGHSMFLQITIEMFLTWNIYKIKIILLFYEKFWRNTLRKKVQMKSENIHK